MGVDVRVVAQKGGGWRTGAPLAAGAVRLEERRGGEWTRLASSPVLSQGEYVVLQHGLVRTKRGHAIGGEVWLLG